MVQSVSAIAYQAEQRKIRAARESARAEPLTDEEIVEGLRKQSDGRTWWLETHGGSGKWPKSEIDRKREELRVLVQAADRIKTLGGKNEPSPG